MTRMSFSLLLVASLCASGCQVFKNDPVPALESPRTSNNSADEAAPKFKPAEATTQETKPESAAQELPPPEQIPATKPGETVRQRLDALAPPLSQGQTLSPQSPLQLERVKVSVVEKFPLIQSVIQEAQIAAGKQQSARGAFDVKLVAESLNMPQGFYKNYRHLVKAEQPTWLGGAMYGQYRIGDGNFQP
jgi:hypothetical protein